MSSLKLTTKETKPELNWNKSRAFILVRKEFGTCFRDRRVNSARNKKKVGACPKNLVDFVLRVEKRCWTNIKHNLKKHVMSIFWTTEGVHEVVQGRKQSHQSSMKVVKHKTLFEDFRMNFDMMWRVRLLLSVRKQSSRSSGRRH